MTPIKDAMAYMDWIESNGDWLVSFMAQTYSAERAGEFQDRRIKARDTREQLRLIALQVQK